MPITLQDIFNAAWQAFIVEDRPPAANSDGVCSYRTKDGRKCAIGLCIPENSRLLKRGMSAGSFAELVAQDRFSDSDPVFSADVHTMPDMVLDSFQAELHDTLQLWGRWSMGVEERKQWYIQTAKHYGLKVPE